GIGPEVIVKALTHQEVLSSAHIVVIGNYEALTTAASKFLSTKLALEKTTSIYDLTTTSQVISVLDLTEEQQDIMPHYGRISVQAAKASVAYILEAIKLAQEGAINAIVTAPISKLAIQKAGFSYQGHTEILASATGVKNYAMAFFHLK
ncbi:MAG: hypothetical protein OMM_14465, partial [Candidatus Magnetoglobus multicellularis str. Araruama]